VKLRPRLRSQFGQAQFGLPNIGQNAWAAPREQLTAAQGEALDVVTSGGKQDEFEPPMWKRMKKMNDKLQGGLVDKIFKEYDHTGKGMRRATLRNFLEDTSAELYGHQTEVTADHVNFILTQCDKSNTDSIIKEELFDALRCWDVYMAQADEVQELFSRYDVDHSDRLEEREVHLLLVDLSRRHGLPLPTPGETHAAFVKADVTETGSIVRMEIGGVVAAYMLMKQRSASGNNLAPEVQFWCETELHRIVGHFLNPSLFQTFFDEICSFNMTRHKGFEEMSEVVLDTLRRFDPPDREATEVMLTDFVLELFKRQAEADPRTYVPKELREAHPHLAARQKSHLEIITED
jgi:Ca2+-binding EF-hand superfamily protein